MFVSDLIEILGIGFEYFLVVLIATLVELVEHEVWGGLELLLVCQKVGKELGRLLALLLKILWWVDELRQLVGVNLLELLLFDEIFMFKVFEFLFKKLGFCRCIEKVLIYEWFLSFDYNKSWFRWLVLSDKLGIKWFSNVLSLKEVLFLCG